MSFECAICSNTLQLSSQDRQELLTKLSGYASSSEYQQWKDARAIQEYQRVTATSCGHLYHRNCLIQWLRVKRQQGLTLSCPYCAFEFESQEDISDLQVKFYSRTSIFQSGRELNPGTNRSPRVKTPTVDNSLRSWVKYIGFLLIYFLLVICVVLVGCESCE